LLEIFHDKDHMYSNFAGSEVVDKQFLMEQFFFLLEQYFIQTNAHYAPKHKYSSNYQAEEAAREYIKQFTLENNAGVQQREEFL